MVRATLALLVCVVPLQAAPVIANHSLFVLAEADALVVGRVLRISVGLELPPPDGRQ